MRIIHIIFFTFTLVAAVAHPGVGIVVDSKGNVFYTDLKQVWKIDALGKKLIVVQNVHTHELFMDEQDNLFGEHLWYNGEKPDTWSHYVWKLSPEGKLEKVIPDTKGFLTADSQYSFVRDHLGRMYWAEGEPGCQHVMRKNSDGSIIQLKTGCLENIRWMKGSAKGAYFVDFQDVKVMNEDGSVKTIANKIANKNWGNSSVANQHAVMGIWDDKHGNVYTAVPENRQVMKFTPQGAGQAIFKTNFPWSPSGGLIDAEGNLWILEFNQLNAVRVEKAGKDGKVKVY